MASLRKRNDKWQAQLRRVGHQPRSKSFLNRADAQRWIRQTELELDRLALAYDPKALERLTVSDLLTRYLAEVTPRKRGAASEAKRIDVFLREKWTGLSLAQISPQAFTQHRDKRLREVKPSTVIRELGLLHAIFEVARLEWDLPLVENPVAKVRKPKAPQGRDRRLESDELAAILKTSEAAKVRWLTPGIVLALETGMRRGEVLNIRATDFDRSRGLLSIPETKTDVPRSIPLTSEAQRVLSQLLEQTGAKDRRLIPVSANAFRLAWERCKRSAAKSVPSISSLRFHDLRHEAVSRYFELGLSVPEVAIISGHRDPRMLFRYTHLRPEDVGDKIRRLQGAS